MSDHTDAGPTGPSLSRRAFLAGAGLGAGGLLAGVTPWGEAANAASQPTFQLRRREDMLRLTVRTSNLRLAGRGDSLYLEPAGGLTPSFLIIDFPPQHVAEQATRDNQPVAALVGSRLSGPSRLVFKVKSRIPLDVESLLDWSALTPSLVPVALEAGSSGGDSPPVLRDPRTTETAIEVPWHLLLSPTPSGRWRHETQAVEIGGRFEVWRTELVASPLQLPVDGFGDRTGRANVRTLGFHKKAVRAVGTTDRKNASNTTGDDGFTGAGKPFPFMTLGPRDRKDIVRASADFTDPARPRPQAIAVEELQLSALGARFALDGRWPDNPGSLLAWSHRGTMGREHAARVVRRGILWPLGHQTTKTVVTEREFLGHPTRDETLAQLRQRTFLTVVEPTKVFGGSNGQPFAGRGLPFTAIRLVTRTVDVDAPTAVLNGVNPAVAFVPSSNGQPVLFEVTAVDWAGDTVTFQTPLVWIEGPNDSRVASERAAFANILRGLGTALASGSGLADQRVTLLKQIDMRGQDVAIAEPSAPGSTTVTMQTLSLAPQLPAVVAAELDAKIDSLLQAGKDVVSPVMEKAAVVLEEATSLASQAEGVLDTLDIAFDDTFKDIGFDLPGVDELKNAGQIYAKALLDEGKELGEQALEFAGDKAAGLVSPSLVPAGLSRNFGVVSGALDQLQQGKDALDKIRRGEFDPKEVFGLLLDSAKLLGGITLKDVVKVAKIDIPKVDAPEVDLPPPPDAMKLTKRKLDDGLEVRLEWRPELESTGPFVVRHDSNNKPISTFVVDMLSTTRYTTDPPGATSTYKAFSELTKFDLDVGFLKVEVERLAFTSATGEKASVDLALGQVTFKEALAFVEEFRTFLKTGGLGPSIDVTGAGVEVAYGIELPTLQVGVFAIQNLRFSVGVNIPFNGDPVELLAEISSKQDPFMLAIGPFGGGGYLSLAVQGTMVRNLEVALEFGGHYSLDIGVASGGVGLTAGIYLGVKNDVVDGKVTSTVNLAGFVRLYGELRVLGIVSLSLEFNMVLGYESATVDGKQKHRAYGQATLIAQVEVLCFSESVELKVEKYFDGNPGDPTFADMLPEPDHWAEYCNAFAPIGAAA